MDPTSSLLDSIEQAASSGSPSAQELHEALMTIIGFEVEEKVRLRGSVTAVDAQRPAVAILTDQLAAMSTRLLPLSTLSTPGLLSGMPASSEVNSDWPSRISLGPAMTSPQPWPRPTRKDLDDRMRESVTAEREASVRFN
jgi:hypothetical protein